MPTFATPGPIAATVEVAGARVRINAGDRTDTAVRVEPIHSASRKDVKVAEKPNSASKVWLRSLPFLSYHGCRKYSLADGSVVRLPALSSR